MWLAGTGLHLGVPCRARWVREPGPLRIRRIDGGVAECVVGLECAEPAERASRVRLTDGRAVETVEHALAAVGARGCFAGVVLEVEGPELPLLDGGAAQWCASLHTVWGTETEPGGPIVEVVREAEFARDGTVLRLRPGPRGLCVATDFTSRSLGAHRVAWDGTWEDFVSRIATARTFGFVGEARALREAGRAAGVEPGGGLARAVVVYGDDGVADPRFASPTDPLEPARHKLLDAIGDLALVGARIEGVVELDRPGHARTLALLSEAERAGAWRRLR